MFRCLDLCCAVIAEAGGGGGCAHCLSHGTTGRAESVS